MELEDKFVEAGVVPVPAGLLDVAEDGSHDILVEEVEGLWDVW
jgi:hypothetical protein